MSQAVIFDKFKVDQALETVCQLGCVNVANIMAVIERGIIPESLGELNTKECACLLNELRSVMQAYK